MDTKKKAVEIPEWAKRLEAGYGGKLPDWEMWQGMFQGQGFSSEEAEQVIDWMVFKGWKKPTCVADLRIAVFTRRKEFRGPTEPIGDSCICRKGWVTALLHIETGKLINIEALAQKAIEAERSPGRTLFRLQLVGKVHWIAVPCSCNLGGLTMRKDFSELTGEDLLRFNDHRNLCRRYAVAMTNHINAWSQGYERNPKTGTRYQDDIDHEAEWKNRSLADFRFDTPATMPSLPPVNQNPEPEPEIEYVF